MVISYYQQYGQPDGDLQMDYNFWVMQSPDATILVHRVLLASRARDPFTLG